MTLALDHRMKVLIGSVLIVAMVLGGWLLGVQPLLASALDSFSQADAARETNTATRAQLAQLAAAQEELPELKKQLAALDASVPASEDASALLRSLDALAAQSGVTIQRVVLEESQPYAAPVAEAAATGTAESGSGEQGTASAVPLPATDPRITGDNLVAIPVSVDVSGSLEAVLAFVSGVQSGSRLFLVNEFSSVADADGGEVTATIAGYVYVLLDAPAGTSAG